VISIAAWSTSEEEISVLISPYVIDKETGNLDENGELFFIKNLSLNL
jgi:hypothetical protein